MSSLTIKGIPDALCGRLKHQAASHRRSLNQEVIVCLEQATHNAAIVPEKWLDEADRLREQRRLTPLTEAVLRKAKREGRP